jgi:hypothetical protein
MGTPWVYQTLRPYVLGGINIGPAYDILGVQPDDVVLDVGCGMGDAMEHLPAFRAYHGFDTDIRALAAFRAKSPQSNVLLYERQCTAQDVAAINPTKVLMIGLLHHIPDPAVVALLQSLAANPPTKTIVTQDPVYLPRQRINNALSRLDRGRFVRTVEGYNALVERSGLTVAKTFWIRTGRNLARYYGMVLARSADGRALVDSHVASTAKQGPTAERMGQDQRAQATGRASRDRS